MGSQRADIVVVGGGIAGLAASWLLARAGAGRVRLLEREPLFCAHASGRNAAILRTLGHDATEVALVKRSRELVAELSRAQRGSGWLDPCGLLYVAEAPDALMTLSALARNTGTAAMALGPRELAERAPALMGGAARAGLLCPGDGVIDIHGLTEALTRAARAAGAELSSGLEVTRLSVERNRVRAAQLSDGSTLEADAFVLAAGAWSAGLGTLAGAPLPLGPVRRHLVLLDGPAKGPVVWAVGQHECYFRAESGGALASPCDEAPFAPSVPPVDPAALELLAHRLAALSPGLGAAAVRSSWACLRTFAPDRGPVAGADPRVAGLYWLGGLGGMGMSAGLAVAEVLAHGVLGRPHPLAAPLAPGRLLPGVTRSASGPPV